MLTTTNPGARTRLHLLRANRDAIAVMIARAVSAGLDAADVVVIVADQRDTVGRELAEAAAEKAGLKAAGEAWEVERRGEIPTAIIVLNVSAARALFNESHPGVHAVWLDVRLWASGSC